MARRLVYGVIGLVGIAALAAVGCGSSKKSGFDDTPMTGFGEAGADTGAFGHDGVPGSCTGPRCSSDLRTQVDCEGKVLVTCPADQGCDGNSGACVPACQAAIDSKGSIGCDYYAVDPDIYSGDGAAGGCFAAFVANTWDTPATLTVEYAGKALDASAFGRIPKGTGSAITYEPLPGGKIPPGEVAILFLNRHGTNPPGLVTDCPGGITPAVSDIDAAAHGTALGQAFHISTDVPVSAYDILPYGGGKSALTSATLLLPTSAWGTNYVGVDAYREGQAPLSLPFLEIVAQQDGTMVTINPTANVLAGTNVVAAAKGTATTYALNRGQVLQLEPATTGGLPPSAPSLSGSIVDSNFPVGLWGGKTSMGMISCCDDSAHQQIPPVRALGSEYVGVRYRNRYDGVEEAPPWRVIGAVDGTVLTWDPVIPTGAPSTLARGQVAEFPTNGPFIVKSQDAQHPFYMSAHMTGCTKNPNWSSDPLKCAGDPEFVNVIPPGEYMQSYVLFSDPTYPETDLVVVRVKAPSGFKDVTLDCAGTITGWQPVGTSGLYEYVRVDLSRHNFQAQGKCDNGRHEMRSAGSFGVTVWGWGSAESGSFSSQYVSYAYPAGASVLPINDVVVVVR